MVEKLICKENGCGFETESAEEFHKHVSDHIDKLVNQKKENYHLHYIDGSDLNDHRSIGDYEFTYNEAIAEAKNFFNKEFQDKLQINECGEVTTVSYPDDSFEKGFEFAIEVSRRC